MTRTALITGGVSGIGAATARQLKSSGYSVIANYFGNDAEADAFYKETGIPVFGWNVADFDDTQQAIARVVAQSGPIDVLVNNAGIGYFGSFEESDLAEVHRMFDINVWGLTNMTRAVLPILRRQRSGTIVNISSIGGLRAFPALSFYNASKFAVEALSEALAQEVAPLGIKTLIVEPGPFRTDWAGRSANEAPQTIEDYHQTSGVRLAQTRGIDGKQAGDPVRAAQAIVKAVEAPDAPLRLLLGKIALAGGRVKLEQLARDFDAWAEVTVGADFPEGE